MTSANEPSLEFEQGFVVDGKPDLQPSGLAVCESRLVFVSDKHENEIYQLTFDQEGVAKVATWKVLSDIPQPPKQQFSGQMRIKRFFAELFGFSGGADWEGIACDDHGNLFLASEYYFAVLKVSASGEKEWLINDLYAKGHRQGLFQKDNAYVEGITLVDGKMLLAAEREPRGIVAVSDDASVAFHVQQELSDKTLPYDYTGLDVYQEKVIALERNHYRVCQLTETFESSACYSFKSITESSNWGYNTGKYGLAEGLAIDGEFLWIIVDNNGDPRSADTKDTRSTIMKFKNPF